jgi:hypothetical protein
MVWGRILAARGSREVSRLDEKRLSPSTGLFFADIHKHTREAASESTGENRPLAILSLGAFLALHAKNRAIRSNSSEALMRFLRDFRFYPIAHTIRYATYRKTVGNKLYKEFYELFSEIKQIENRLMFQKKKIN